MESKQEMTEKTIRSREIELEEIHVERELNLLIEMTLKMEHELQTLTLRD